MEEYTNQKILRLDNQKPRAWHLVCGLTAFVNDTLLPFLHQQLFLTLSGATADARPVGVVLEDRDGKTI